MAAELARRAKRAVVMPGAAEGGVGAAPAPPSPRFVTLEPVLPVGARPLGPGDGRGPQVLAAVVIAVVPVDFRRHSPGAGIHSERGVAPRREAKVGTVAPYDCVELSSAFHVRPSRAIPTVRVGSILNMVSVVVPGVS